MMLRLDRLRLHSASGIAAGIVVLTALSPALRTQAPAQPPPQPAPSTIPSSATLSAQSTQFSPAEVADSMMFHKRYQEAIAKYENITPKTAPIWNKMGIAYQMMFNMNDAVRCYKESLKLDPKDVGVYNNLGTVYESQQNHRQADKMYRKAIELNPQFALAYKNLATSLMAQHKFKQGGEANARALQLDPSIFDPSNTLTVDNPASAKDRGAINYYTAIDCVRAGRTACALEHLRMALNQGYISASKVAADSRFAPLSNDPAFQQLLAEQTSK
jgi:tetratricopeptide (TPR) repeat protein